MVKNSPANSEDVGDWGLNPRWEKFHGEGNDNPLQCSCLENPMDRGPWQATVYGVTKSPRRLKRLSTYACNVKFPEFSVLNFRKFT